MCIYSKAKTCNISGRKKIFLRRERIESIIITRSTSNEVARYFVINIRLQFNVSSRTVVKID